MTVADSGVTVNYLCRITGFFNQPHKRFTSFLLAIVQRKGFSFGKWRRTDADLSTERAKQNYKSKCCYPIYLVGYAEKLVRRHFAVLYYFAREP